MNEIKQQIIGQLTGLIHNTFGVDLAPIELVYPVFAGQGDLSFPCFGLAKSLGKSPVEIAQSLMTNWVAIDNVAEVKAEGPYLNFYLQTEKLAQWLYTNFDQSVQNVGQGAKVMIEFANGNTHKEFHIGHLRNVAYGAAVAGLLTEVGYEVIPVSYVNDFGIHTAKTIWQLKTKPLNDDAGVNRGFLLGQAYTEAVARMGDDPVAKEEVGQIMTEIESRSGAAYKLWQTTREWSIDYFKSIYSILKIDFSHFYFESELIDQGKAYVSELLAKGILIESQGAVIADLSADDLGVLVILRQDGTALYPVADLALAINKFASADLSQSIIVVDKRQGLYFKQLFTLLKKLGYDAPMIHLPYDVVTLPSGMMSSRLGNVVLFNDLYQQCKNNLIAETKARHNDWSVDKINDVAEKITVATLKFEMIKVSAEKIITFNINEALRFEGYTAAYLQYTGARINSLLAKAGQWTMPLQLSYTEQAEKNLILVLAKYAEIVSQAAKIYEPSLLTQYLFDLAQTFNDFYQSCHIISAEEDIRNNRLRLADQAKQTLSAGLAILGIEIIQEM